MDTTVYKQNNKRKSNIYVPKKLNFKYDKDILEMFIGYVFSTDSSITKLSLNNLHKLISITDSRTFELDSELYARFNLLKMALEGKLFEGIERVEILKEYCHQLNNPDTDEVLANIDNYTKLSKKEIKFLTDGITDRLRFACIIYYKDIILDQFMRIDQGDFKSFKQISLAIKDQCAGLLNDMRKAENSVDNDTFSLDDDVFEQFVKDTVEHAADPNTALITGIRTLNEVLSPGFLPCRLYLVIALSGTYKSSFLIYCAYWIKKYNRVTPRRKDPSAVPCVLMYLLENDIEETIIRLFNICASTDDISNYTPAQVYRMMREGGLTLKQGEINIILKYRPANTLSPNDIASDIDTLEDDNKEVIALIVDYLKRMRSDFPAPDDRVKLRDISNGIKDILIRYKIPGISAQQINRSGSVTIDSAMESGKEDLTRYLGRSNIADAWDLFENVDWCCILNVEIERSSGNRFLTFKELKKRYRSMTDITYFNHPFVEGSTIMLVNDVELDKSVSKTSLSSNMYGMPEQQKKSVPALNQFVNSNISTNQFGDLDSLVYSNTASIWIDQHKYQLWNMKYKEIKPIVNRVDKACA